MNSQLRFESSDIYLSAYLVSQGAKLEGVERDKDNRMVFLIGREDNLDSLLRDYWSNEPVTVIPSQLFAGLKFLKSLLYSSR